MHLKLDTLQKVVKKAIEDEKAAMALKTEITRVLGPVVVSEGKLSTVVAEANDRLDVLDRTGRTGGLSFRPASIAAFLNDANPEVRKFAVRVLPESFLRKMVVDRDPAVRAAVAARLSLQDVRSMIKRFPKDDQLRSIFRQKRKLAEAGLAKPTVEPMGHDPVEDAERMGDDSRSMPGPELSETWYHEQAMRFLYDYGRNIEYAWEENAVHRFCASLKSSFMFEIDEEKLLKVIKGLIEEKEDKAFESNPLKETLSWLEAQDELEMLVENTLPEMVEVTDPVAELVREGLTSEQLLSRAAEVFQVRESMLPLGIRKHRLGEGNAKQTLVPCVGRLPHRFGFRPVDERALDSFCEAWTRRQQIMGEPLRLEWVTHPSEEGKIGFTCILK